MNMKLMCLGKKGLKVNGITSSRSANGPGLHCWFDLFIWRQGSDPIAHRHCRSNAAERGSQIQINWRAAH